MDSANFPGANFPGAGMPPPGVTPNLENPESIGYRIIIVAAVFPAITGVFLCIRLYTAQFILKRWHTDDYLIVAAFVLALGDSVSKSLLTTYGAGTHIWNVTKPMYLEFAKIGVTACAFFYESSTLFTKFSILFFYLRFSSTNRAFRMVVYFVMLAAAGYTIPMAISFSFQCQPVALAWDPRLMGTGKCLDIVSMAYITGVINAVVDFIILLLPIWLLKPLRIPLAKKLGVLAILMTGGFVCVISAMRAATVKITINETDFTWACVPSLVWVLVELYVGILCACLPCLKPFTKRYFPGFSIFSNNLESRLSTTITAFSGRVRDITTSLGVSAGARTTMSEARGQSRSKVGADMLQSKPSHSPMFDGADIKGTAVCHEQGSSSEGSSTSKEFHVIGEEASGSTLREENGVTVAGRVDV